MINTSRMRDMTPEQLNALWVYSEWFYLIFWWYPRPTYEDWWQLTMERHWKDCVIPSIPC